MRVLSSIEQLLDLTGKRIAFFSNAFNPPHFGHLDFIKKAVSIKNLDHIILCPQNTDEHIKVEELKHRMRIMDLIMETSTGTDIFVLSNTSNSNIESELFMDDIIYLLKRRQKEIFVLVGCDSLEKCSKDFESHNVTFIVGCRVKRSDAEKQQVTKNIKCVFIDDIVPCNAEQLASDIKNQNSYLSPELLNYIESNNLYWFNSNCENCN